MISNRIIEFANNQGITKYRMSKLLNVSTSFFDKERNSVSSDILVRLLELYPQIDLYYILTGTHGIEFLRNKIKT